jgi:eukaryotic-like serine/threonine-protein kinase
MTQELVSLALILSTLTSGAWIGEQGVHPELPLTASGTFDQPPVLDWLRVLPGVPAMSATHTERSAPAFDGTWIYLGQDSNNAVYQIHPATGMVNQTFSTKGPVQSEIQFVDGDLIFCDLGGYTHRFAPSGEGAAWIHFGGAPIASTPTLHDGVLYVSNVDDTVYALDAATGELQWRYARPADPTRSSELTLFGAPTPTIVGDQVLVGFADGNLVALRQSDGQVTWERRVGEGRYPDLIGTPLVMDGTAYVGGFSEPLVAVDLETRNIRWRLEGVGSATLPTPHEGVLFHGGTDGQLRKITQLDGEVLWAWDSQTTGALTRPQLTAAGLLVGSSDGTLYLVDPDSGLETWRWDPDMMLDGVTVAPLLLERQAIVVTNAGRLMSLVVPAQTDAWDPDGADSFFRP